MKSLIKLVSFLFVFSIPFYDVPKTFRDGIALSGIIGVPLLFLFLIGIKNKKKVLNFPKEPTFLMGLFMIFYSLSMLFNVYNLEERAPNHLVFYTYSFLVYTIIPFFVMNAFGAKWFVKVLSYSVIVVSIIGLVEVSLYYLAGYSAYATFLNHGHNVGTFGGFPRIRSTFNEPSHFALFLDCTLPLLWYYKRWLSFLIGFVTLILTFPTSTFFGMIVASTIVVIGLFLLLPKRPLRFFGVLVCIIPVLVLFKLYIYEPLYYKIFNIRTEDSYRYYTWLSAFHEALEKPILGYGPAGYYLKHEYGLFNWYLQIFYESGILGLVSLLLLIFTVLKKTLRVRSLVFTFFFLTFVFSMVVMNHYYLPGFWIFIAFIYYIDKEKRQQLNLDLERAA